MNRPVISLLLWQYGNRADVCAEEERWIAYWLRRFGFSVKTEQRVHKKVITVYLLVYIYEENQEMMNVIIFANINFELG